MEKNQQNTEQNKATNEKKTQHNKTPSKHEEEQKKCAHQQQQCIDVWWRRRQGGDGGVCNIDSYACVNKASSVNVQSVALKTVKYQLKLIYLSFASGSVINANIA